MRYSIPSSRRTILREALVVLILFSYLALTFGFSLILPRSLQSNLTAQERQCCCCTDRCATGACCCARDEEEGDHPKLKVRWVIPAIDQKCHGDGPSVLPALEPSISVPIAAAIRFDVVGCGEVISFPSHFRSHSDIPPGPPPRA